MMNCYPSLKRYFYNVVVLPIRFIPFMNLMFNASVKVKNTKNTNLVTKSPLYVLPQVSFLVQALLNGMPIVFVSERAGTKNATSGSTFNGYFVTKFVFFVFFTFTEAL